METNNPYLKVQDPYEEQKEVAKKASEGDIEFQRLCFETFHANKDGKHIIEKMKERFLYPRMFDPDHAKAGYLACYWEGFKDAIRTLEGHARIHLNRINSIPT